MVADYGCVRAAQDGEMPELRGAVVAQLDVVCVRVQHNRPAILRQSAAVPALKIAAVNQHSLTALAMAGDRLVQRAADPAIPHMENMPRWRQQNPACAAITVY